MERTRVKGWSLVFAAVLAGAILPTATATAVRAAPHASAPGQARWVQDIDGGGVDWSSDMGTDLVVSSDGARVYAVGFTEEEYSAGIIVVAYDLQSGAELWAEMHPLQDYGWPGSIAVTPDGARVLVSFQDGKAGPTVLALHPDTGAELWRTAPFLPRSRWPSVGPVLAMPDSSAILTGSFSVRRRGGRVFAAAIDAAGRVTWRTIEGSKEDSMGGTDAALSADASALFLVGTRWGGRPEDGGTATDPLVVRIDPTTGDLVFAADFPRPGYQDPASATAASDGSQVFVSGGTGRSWISGAGMVFNVSGVDGSMPWFRRVRTLDDTWFPSIALSPDDGTVVVTGSGTDDLALEGDVLTMAFAADTGQPAWERFYDGDYGGNNNTDDGNDVTFNPDGTTVYVTGRTNGDRWSAGDFLIMANDIATGDVLWSEAFDGTGLYGDFGRAVSVNPAGDTVVATGSFGQSGPQKSNMATAALETS